MDHCHPHQLIYLDDLRYRLYNIFPLFTHDASMTLSKAPGCRVPCL